MLKVPFAPVARPAGRDRHWVAIAFAGAVNLALIYSLGSGLAIRFVEKLPSVLEVNVVEKQPRVADPTLPPPPAPEFATPSPVPEIPVPKIAIAHVPPAPHAITAIAVEKPLASPERVVPTAPVKAAPVISPTRARGVEGTHTTPPYPPVALRLGEEGTVRLHIALDGSGRIQDVTVAKTSGSERLDAAAVNWVAKHWRYAPATRDGKPVASFVLADVRFNLKAAH